MKAFIVLPILNTIVFSLLGYLMKVHKMVDFLAGYDPNKVKDKEGLANWVGSNFIYIAVISLIMVLIGIFFPVYYTNLRRYYLFINIFIVIFFVIRIAIGAKKY